MKMTQVLTIVVMVAALAMTSTAEAKQSKRIITPPLRQPLAGSLLCFVANASDINTVVVSVTIYHFDGTVEGTGDGEVLPNGSFAVDAPSGRHCVVEIVSGKAKDVRVSLLAIDSFGTVVAAVQGY